MRSILSGQPLNCVQRGFVLLPCISVGAYQVITCIAVASDVLYTSTHRTFSRDRERVSLFFCCPSCAVRTAHRGEKHQQQQQTGLASPLAPGLSPPGAAITNHSMSISTSFTTMFGRLPIYPRAKETQPIIGAPVLTQSTNEELSRRLGITIADFDELPLHDPQALDVVVRRQSAESNRSSFDQTFLPLVHP